MTGVIRGTLALCVVLVLVAAFLAFLFAPGQRAWRPGSARLTAVQSATMHMAVSAAHGDRAARSSPRRSIAVSDGSTVIRSFDGEAASSITRETRNGVTTITLRNDQGVMVKTVTGAPSKSLARYALFGVALLSLLYIGYVFLDASTRGHFTWQLRFASFVALAGLCLAVLALQNKL